MILVYLRAPQLLVLRAVCSELADFVHHSFLARPHVTLRFPARWMPHVVSTLSKFARGLPNVGINIAGRKVAYKGAMELTKVVSAGAGGWDWEVKARKPPPPCISYAFVQATAGAGIVLIWYLI